MLIKNKKIILALMLLLFLVVVVFHCVMKVQYNHVQPLMQMNDVPSIVDGYKKTPNLLLDGARWWHGAWIETGIGAYRPLSSYLLWTETHLVLQHGFVPIVAIGGLLLLLICIAAALVAWQLTHSYLCATFAGVLSTFVTTFNFGGTSVNWIAWYPVHHDLLNILFALLATFAFLRWMEKGERKYITLCWVFFIAGILTKEYLYIFPLFALCATLTYRYYPSHKSRKRLLLQPALMLGAVIFFYLFRQSVLPHPYMPHELTRHMLITHSLLFWFHSFYMYLPSGIYFLPAVAVLTSLLFLPIVRSKKVLLAAGIGVLLVIIYSTYGVADLFWYFADGEAGAAHLSLFVQMLFVLYSFYLVYKYRKTQNGILAYALMMMAYLPTFSYLGWHYSLSGWFYRCAAFWPMIAMLVYQDVKGFRWNNAMFSFAANGAVAKPGYKDIDSEERENV